MQLMNIGAAGAERPVARGDDGSIYDLSPLTTAIDGSFLETNGITRVREALDRGSLTRIDAEGQRIGAPLVRPGAVVCLGQNYAAHAAESGSEPPEEPIVFFKTPNTVVGPYDDVLIPRGAEKTDWEVELCIVIGKTASYLDSPDDAAACIAGYAIANDVSEREFQRDRSGGQWSKGKCCATFNPLGPWLVPGDEVDPQALGLRSRVNGEIRQDSTTADMIFSARYVVWHLSHFMTLDPGYIINTGTPQGVALSGRFPYLKAGDVMELEIDKLGHQRQALKPA